MYQDISASKTVFQFHPHNRSLMAKILPLLRDFSDFRDFKHIYHTFAQPVQLSESVL
jgi:hypothetical protein